MFGFLSDFKTILVSGPQRSGTTICHRMVVHDTQHIGFDENDFGVYDKDRFKELVAKPGKKAIHCPAASVWLHEFGDEDTAVLFMYRPLEDIYASERRINWADPVQYKMYDLEVGGPVPVAQQKYEVWEQQQKQQIANAFPIEYSTLRHHPLWVPKAARAEFLPRQWRKDNVNA